MEIKTRELKEELLDQKNRKIKGSIYHWSQVTFAYNSNKIEGSCLTEDQTEQIFDTNNVFAKKENEIDINL